MNKIIENIKEKANKSRFIFGRTNIFIKDSLPEHISIDALADGVESILPSRLLRNIDMIYVGQFDVLNSREVNALYAEGAIYITNDQTDIADMLDDIIHEVAHSLEEELSMDIYGDGEIEMEFIGKRVRLKSIIVAQGYFVVDNYDFLDPEHSPELDNFFYKEIGYSLLSTITQGLFNSVYACTSLREYFANGFETFYLGDRNYLSTVSPKLYNKLMNLHNIGEQQ
tara:strand:+ start:147 stop:824 length:678 start_codon:yes stop_codon:yes gene_type:complete